MNDRKLGNRALLVRILTFQDFTVIFLTIKSIPFYDVPIDAGLISSLSTSRSRFLAYESEQN